MMPPECTEMSMLHASHCATGVDDGWFALSHFGQSICDPILKLAAGKYTLWLLESGTPKGIPYGCQVAMG